MRNHTIALLLACLVSAALWCQLYQRVEPRAWKQLQGDYASDGVQILAWIKAAADGDYTLFGPKNVAKLGYPNEGGGRWHAFPMYAEVEIQIAGWFARHGGIPFAQNMTMLLARITAAIGAYLACAWLLRLRPLWSFTGAVLWSTLYFHTFRGDGHVFLAYTWAVPLVVAFTWVAPRVSLWTAAGVGVCGGFLNPYFMAMGVILVTLFSGDAKRVGAFNAGVAGAFLLNNADTLLSGAETLKRDYFVSEIGSLKLFELLLPFPEHPLGKLAQYYKEVAFVRGELFSAYLGLVLIGALCWMVYEWVIRDTSKKESLQVVFVTLACALGGLGCALSLVGITFFRAPNRWSVFIAAVLMLWLMRKLNDKSLTKGWSMLISVWLLVVSGGEMLAAQNHINPKAIAQYENDAEFGRALDAKMPGAKLYCFPPMAFPDTNPVGPVLPYDMLKPWLHTTNIYYSTGRACRDIDDFDKSMLAGLDFEKVRARGYTGGLLSKKILPAEVLADIQNKFSCVANNEFIATRFE